MLWLPEVRQQRRTWRFAVSTAGAASLGKFLLSNDSEGSAALATALADEPFFVMWAIVQAGDHLGVNPTLTEVVEWMADNSHENFVGGEVCTEPAKPDWLDAAATGISVASLAAKSAQPETSPAYLLGLLYPAERYLTAAEIVPTSSPSGSSSPLPEWLRSALHDVESSTPAGNAVRAVRAAIESARQPTSKLRSRLQRRWKPPTEEASLAMAVPQIAQMKAELFELSENYQKTLEQEKLASLRQLAYGASHEINNPLANISTRAQTLLRDEHDPDRRRKLATISAQAFRAHEMISDMMLFAKPPALVVEQFELSSWVRLTLTELADEAESRDIQLSWDVDSETPNVSLEADGEQLAVALRALVRNSFEAMDVGGSVHVECVLSQETDPASVALTVQDTGPGISDEVRRHLFDPFYSGREAGRGLGLGLSKCWRIVTLHGGSIEVESPAGGGARITLRIPMTPCPSNPTAG